MRTDYQELPIEIKEHGMDFHWDNQKMWELDIPIEEIDVSEIDWVLDLPFWRYEDKKYSLCPRKVLQNIDSYQEHRDRILKADISYPIDIMKNRNDAWVILDGVHRLTRLILEGNKNIRVRKISRDLIPLISK